MPSSSKPLFFPRLVFWYATEKCDLKCKHCCYPPSGGRELNTREAKLLIDSLARVGVKALAFIGGEPILRDDIFELCYYCVERGMTPHLITKGKSLTRKDCERFSRIGVWITIGVDTFTHRTAGLICGVEELPDISARTLEDCVELGIYKGTVSAILAPNLNEVLTTIDRVARRGSRHVIFSFRPTGRGREVWRRFMPSPEDHEKVLRDVAKGIAGGRWPLSEVFVYDPLFLRVLSGFNVKYDRVRACRIGDYMDIDSEGNVIPCLFAKAIRLGNILEEDLLKIRREMLENVLLTSLKSPDNLKGKCSSCKYEWVCGGCRVRAYELTGDWFASDPLCAYLPD